jgi:hypothetical protein
MRRVLLATAALALLASASPASEGPGILVELENLAGPATYGQTLTFGVRLEAGRAVTLRGFTLRGGSATGGPAPVTGLPDSLPLSPGAPAHLTLQTVPTGGDLRYTFRFDMGGTTVTRFFDLSRGHFDRMFRTSQSVVVPDVVLPPPNPAWNDDPGPGTSSPRPAFLKPLRDLTTTPASVQATTGRHVRVKGRVVYTRDDGQTVGADRLTVKILDQETGPSDDLLEELRTESDGSFDVTVWSDEDAPDLYLEFITLNGGAEVQDGTWNTAYRWETGRKVDFTGATADFGTRNPPDAWIKAAVHMHTNLTRGFRWYKNTMGITPPKQALEWPSGDWPHYDSYGGDLHIPVEVGGQITWDYAWRTDVHLHEYGHFLTNEVIGYRPDNTYDNNICDNANGDPGHCLFCEEDGGTAIKEGWSNYFADEVLQVWTAAYGIAPNDTRDQESLAACMDNSDPAMSCACNPFITEGHLGRLLRDLSDNTPDEVDPLGHVNGQDLVSVGPVNVINIFHLYDIDSPAEYIQRFREYYPGVGAAALWATLANNDYVLADNTPPPVPNNFHSTDHAVGFQNSDYTITMAWDAAADDFSGVDHYNVWRRVAGAPTWTSMGSTTNTFIETSELSPGWYDFRIQSVDRAGNASGYGLLGSFGVRDPYPADFTSGVPTGWDYHVVPRDANDATTTNCTLPAQLDGGVANTWFNVASQNVGELASTENNFTRLLLDGVPFDSLAWGFMNPGAIHQSRNRGPRTVRGGRHTVEAWYDATEEFAEHSETNNRKGRQFTWVGEKVSINTRVRRAAPPDPTGGHNSFTVIIPAVKWKNVDGLYYTHTSTVPFVTYSWAAMWVAPLSNTANYDCYIQTHSTGTQDGGYTDGLVTSNRAAGLLDAVITNTASSWDVGVLNTSRSTSDYFASCVVGGTTPLAVGDSAVITLADSSMMAMRMLTTPSGSAKTIVEVERLTGTAPLYTLWLADDYTYGTISQYDGKVGTDAAGRSELTVTSTASAQHGLVFYRNPANGWGAVSFKVRIRQKPGDVAPITPSGWHSALVPRPVADGTTASVPAPASLTGESAFTYLNASLTNASDATLAGFRVDLRQDRSLVGQLFYPFGLAAGAVVRANNVNPALLAAGRHVLHMQLDAGADATETSESNNLYGEQWVWAPPASPLGTPLWRRGTSGSPVEGWASCPIGEPLAFNVDGVRTPAFSPANAAGWAGVAVTPRAGHDVDLQLHEISTSPTDGFDETLAFSQWDGDATEFVLVDFAHTALRPFDVGVVRASDDTSSYVVNLVGSTLRSPANGAHGPFTLDAGRVLELHALDLPAGHHVIELVNQSGEVDWGLAAYGGPRPYQNRSDAEDLAVSDSDAEGGNERIEFDLAAPERIGVAVWKTGAATQGEPGTYALAVNAAWVGVTAPPAGATRLLGARPSPFTGGTSVAFELARAGEATVELFDVTGARVRTLARGAHAAGRHAIAWSGTDDAGRRLPAGIYLVRLAADGIISTSKVVRLD